MIATATQRTKLQSVAVGTALGQVATVVSAAIAADLYATEALGILGLVSGFAAPLAIITTWRLEMGLPTISDELQFSRTRRHLLAAATLLCLVALVAGMMMLVATWANHLDDRLGLLVFAVPFASAAIIAHDATSFAAVRAERFDLVGRGGLVVGVVQAAILIVGGLIWPVALVAVIAMPLGRVAAARAMGLTSVESSRRWKPSFVETYRENASHVRNMVPSGLIVAILPIVPTLTIAAAMSLSEAGIFFTIQRLVSVPTRLLASSISKVTYGSFGDGLGRPADLYAHVRSGLTFSAPAAMCVTAGGFALGLFDIASLLGPEWAESERVIFPIAFAAAAQLLVSPFQFLLIPLRRFGTILALHSARLALLLIASLLIVTRDFTLVGAAYTISVALSLGYIAFALLTAVSLRSYFSSQPAS